MGQLDKKMNDVPTYDVFNLQSTIIFNDNKTNEWLKRKSLQEKEKVINDVRKKKTRKLFLLTRPRKHNCYNNI